MRKTLPLLLLAILLVTSCRLSDEQRTTLVHSVTVAILNAVASGRHNPAPPAMPTRAAFHQDPAPATVAPHDCPLQQVASASCPDERAKPNLITSTGLQLPKPTSVIANMAVLRPADEVTPRQRVCSVASEAQKHFRRALLLRIVEFQNAKCIIVTTAGQPAMASADEGEEDRPTRS